jgi:hypothetical protein
LRAGGYHAARAFVALFISDAYSFNLQMRLPRSC